MVTGIGKGGWQQPLLAATATMMLAAILASSAAAQQEGDKPRTAGGASSNGAGPVIAVSKFDPAAYVTIYEEDRPDHRILLFGPDKRSTLLRVDADSKIIVELSGLTSDMVLNNVFMTAELSRLAADAPAANVEVINYSEVARDAATQASQAGVALRTAGEVKTVLQSLYSATKDAVRAAYGEACVADPVSGGKPPGCAYTRTEEGDGKLRTVLRASQPRIDAVAEFFTSDRNGLVLSAIGANVFELDLRSLKAMAEKFGDDVAKFIAGDKTPESVTSATDLHLNLQRLWDDMQPLRVATRTDTHYFDTQWRDVVFKRFKDALAPGIIDLRKYRAADGETMRLNVQSRAAGGEGTGGVSRDFHFAIKKLKPRVTTEPSAFYMRRQAEVRNDKGEVVPQKFAPAPGVTFGVVFYSRKPALAVLAPGIGVNVSFMNFGTGDFDAEIKDAAGAKVGGFKAASGGSLQVGVGVTASVFSNAIQFTYGRNLQVDGKRPYYAGIGFGFVQVAQELAKLAKK